MSFVDDRRSVDITAATLMFLICFIWAFQSIGLKFTASDASPVLQIGLRSGLAAVLVGCVIRWRGPRLRWTGAVAASGWLAGFLFALNYYLVGEALNHTSASHVVVFLYTAPIFSAIGLHLGVRAERLSFVQWIGIAVAGFGIAYAFLGSPSEGASPNQGPSWRGDLLALFSGLVWGANTVVIRLSKLSSAPATHSLFYQLAAGFVMLTGFAVITGEIGINPSFLLISNLVFQTLAVSFFSFFIWFWLLTRYSASQLGVYSFVTPIFGVVLGFTLLGEPVTSQFLVGAAGVIVGISVVSAYPWISRRAIYKRRAHLRT